MSETFESKMNMMNSEKSLARFINLSSLIAPKTIIGHDGELVTTWRVEGVAFETSGDLDLDNCINQLNILYRSLASSKVAVQIHRVRRRISDSLSPCSELGFAHELSLAYNQTIGQESLMATELYFTLIFRRNSKKTRKNRNKEDIAYEISERLEKFEKIASQIERSLSRFEPKRLGEYTNKKGRYCSEQLSFYYFLISGVWHGK